jgi:CRP-like cAMP-binding protein
MMEMDKTQLSLELREIPALAGLPDEDLAWLIEKGEEVRLATNEVYLREGEPADRLVIVVEVS